MRTSAEFSDDRVYRYRLDRVWSEDILSRLIVIGLNPSTADEEANDPTIRRCISFAEREDCGGLVMLNLFAYRSADPSALRKVFDPVGGPRAHDVLVETCYPKGNIVVAAWGVPGVYMGRDRDVRAAMADMKRDLYVFGLTKGGFPKHPLYLRNDTPLVEWPYAKA